MEVGSSVSKGIFITMHPKQKLSYLLYRQPSYEPTSPDFPSLAPYTLKVITCSNEKGHEKKREG